MKLRLLCSVGFFAIVAGCAQQNQIDTRASTPGVTEGYVALNSGNLSSAEGAFTAALTADPNDSRAVLGLARVRRAQGDIAGAGALFAKAELIGRGEISSERPILPMSIVRQRRR